MKTAKMSKKFNTSQSNTLLNYFQSPKAQNLKEKTAINTPTATTPKSSKSKPKVEEDESPVVAKKRKKVNVIDSNSEDEIENNTPVKPSKKRRVRKASIESDYSEPSSEDEEAKPKKKSLKKFSYDSTPSKPAAKPEAETPKASAAPSQNIHTSWLHNRLEFLKPGQIRDAARNRPEEPDYNFRTLFVPKEFLDKQTPAMRQWWLLKSQHMDSVIFFKVGKFYELYHMDAVVGVTQLNFSYMKGEFAHSGFPEQAYYRMANSLIEKGYKVARTEQTETPEMMAERCRKQAKTTKFDKVVRREICQISTKATCVYNAQLPDAMHSLPCYLFAICEKEAAAKTRHFGVCFVDTSIGVFHMGQFEDDKHCSKLLTVLSEYTPGLILTERGCSPKLKEVLSTYYRDTSHETLAPNTQFYSSNKTIEKLINGKYFRNEEDELKVPEYLSEIFDGFSAKIEHELSVRALGACLWYLEDSQLDIQVVSMGKFEKYDAVAIGVRNASEKSSLILDAITLNNLNLLGTRASLQKTIDHCQTAFGKRLLQQWICRPLCNVGQIRQRQDAVDELYKNPAVLKEAQDVLKKLPDLERQIAKIHSYGNRFYATEHPDSRAVFYEAAKYSKRRIGDLLRTLQGFEGAQQVAAIFSSNESPLLQRITQFAPSGMYVDLAEPLKFFKGAFDQNEAEKEGKIIPRAGCDANYDAIEAEIANINADSLVYLKELEKHFGCKLAYFGSDKKRFQIDVPEKFAKKATSEFQLEGARKGAKPSQRYSTSRSRQILEDLIRAETERAKIIQDLNRLIFEKFSRRRELWEQAINCLSVLDVLCSMAEFARNYAQDVCIPKIEPFSSTQKIAIENGRHPCIQNVSNFVPNDTKMGVDASHAPVLLVTGPNMGGKSTLMRQVAVICVMAQMGGFVPASRCELSLIDRIFTRLGAHDDIVQGQSTFLVELSEASSILQHATQHSLVLLDELGRGTSTHDGNAIATAYVQKLTEIRCRALFATHYHSLVDYYEAREDVQLGHMACIVEHDGDAMKECVTFLYKMAAGKCPKSYGFNVARLAGLDHAIIARGRQVAQQMEKKAKDREVLRKLCAAVDVVTVRDLLKSLQL